MLFLLVKMGCCACVLSVVLYFLCGMLLIFSCVGKCVKKIYNNLWVEIKSLPLRLLRERD